MIWEKITNDHSSLQEYRLINNTKTLILKYNPLHRSVRISFNNERRLFYIEGTGSSNSKVLLRNEYGMETGNIAFGRFPQGAGIIRIDDTLLNYELKNGRLSIYDQTGYLPQESCDVHPENLNSDNHTSDFNIELTCHLIGLGCYSVFSSANNTSLHYATAS